MICGRCGAKGTDGARFCPQCGQAFPADTAWGSERQLMLSVVYPEEENFEGRTPTVKMSVDGGSPYRLKNGQAVSIPVTAGVHTIRFSYVNSFYKKDVQLHVAGDRTLVLRPSGFFQRLAIEETE